jgi:hypothetical protein
MRNRVLETLTSYSNWIITNYHAIVKANSSLSTLRLISSEHNKFSGELYFIVQVVGKNIFPKLLTNDFKQSNLINLFNSYDQQDIKKYIENHAKLTTKSITARTYNRNTKQFVYTIEAYDRLNNVKISQHHSSLSNFLSDISYFDDQDAALIKSEKNKNNKFEE